MIGVTVKACTLAPRNVHGVDQATIGIVMPRQLVGVEFRQPQSAVLKKYRPCGRGAPSESPTVSPGCVTDPASAVDIPIHTDSAPAVAAIVNLRCISSFPRWTHRRAFNCRSVPYPQTGT